MLKLSTSADNKSVKRVLKCIHILNNIQTITPRGYKDTNLTDLLLLQWLCKWVCHYVSVNYSAKVYIFLLASLPYMKSGKHCHNTSHHSYLYSIQTIFSLYVRQYANAFNKRPSQNHYWSERYIYIYMVFDYRLQVTVKVTMRQITRCIDQPP